MTAEQIVELHRAVFVLILQRVNVPQRTVTDERRRTSLDGPLDRQVVCEDVSSAVTEEIFRERSEENFSDTVS